MPTGNIIRIKRSATENSVPSTTALVNAELAFNEHHEILYYGKGGNASASSSVITIGGKGAYVTLGDAQAITGRKTIDVSNLRITKNGATANQVLTLTDPADGTIDWTNVASNAFSRITIGSTNIDANTASDAVTFTNTNGVVTLTGSNTDNAAVVDFNVRGASTLQTGVVQLNDQLATDAGTTVAPTHSLVYKIWNKIVGQGAIGDTGAVRLATEDPQTELHAANKRYVDAQVSQALQGLDIKASVKVATTTDLNADYIHGSGSGVGATLTAKAFPGAIVIDGITLALTDRVLVKNQANAFENGIYTVTTVGSASVNWVLTRATDFDYSQASNPKVTSGSFTFVEQGTTNADTGWVLTTDNTITLGTTGLTFTQFSGAGAITAGSGLTQSGTTINVVTADVSRIVVNNDNIDLAQVSQLNTTGTAGINFVQSVTVDAYGRLTGRTTADVRAASTTITGIVQLNNNTNSTSTSQAATANAVRIAYDLANAALPKAGGTMTGKLILPASTSSLASITIPNGVDVSGGSIGDLWNYGGILQFNNGTVVKSIAFTDSEMTGTWNGTAIPVNKGGTNITSYAVGDLIYANGATSLAKLTAAAAGNVLLSGGLTTAPSWGKVDLTNATHITGNLPPANGGTGVSSIPLGLLKGIIGGSEIVAATDGTDYAGPAQLQFKLRLLATSSSTAAGINIHQGSEDAAVGLANGDLWNNGGTLKFRSAGATKNIAFTDSALTGNTTGTAANVTGVVAVANGGTGVTAFTDKGIFYANGTTAVGFVAGTYDAASFTGPLLSVGSGNVPTFTNTINGGTY